MLEGEMCMIRNDYNSSQLMHCEIIRFTAEDFHCKKYAKSGLRARSPSNTTELSQSEDADPFEHGGLCDDDLEDVQPAVVEGPSYLSCGNEVSVVCHLSGSSTLTPIPLACQGCRKIQRHPTKQTSSEAQGK
jgi:hypothetical protein